MYVIDAARLFFFFKRKTEYEMRISEWSSDVCSADLPHVQRRYLVVPGIRSSRLHVIDTGPDPRQPKIVKVIEPETVFRRAGYRSKERRVGKECVVPRRSRWSPYH